MYLVQYLAGDSVYILQEMGLKWRMQFVRTQLARYLAMSKRTVGTQLKFVPSWITYQLCPTETPPG